MRGYLMIIAISVMLGLTGCADVQMRKGTEITLYPVMYQLNVDANSSDIKQVEQQIYGFVEHYWPVVSTQSVRIRVFNADGLLLANKLKAYLLHRGVARDNIMFESSPAVGEYDLEVAVIRHMVETKPCQRHSVFRYFDPDYGCHLENNRWKSMVHPERAVGNASP